MEHRLCQSLFWSIEEGEREGEEMGESTATTTQYNENVDGEGQETIPITPSSSSGASPRPSFSTDGGPPPLVQMTLATELIHTLMELLFLEDFTVPRGEHSKVPHRLGDEHSSGKGIWTDGLGANMTVFGNPSPEMINARVDTLRCLLVCVSQQLYFTGEELARLPNPWLDVATSPGCPNTRELFLSILNTLIDYNPNEWFPYSQMLSADPEEGVVEVGVKVLTVLTIYTNPTLPLDHTNYNVYQALITTVVDSDKDMAELFAAFSNLLNNPMIARNTYLPGSTKQVNIFQELLVLLWLLCDSAPEFLAYILRYEDINQIVVPICGLLMDAKSDPTKVGLCHTCVFLLLMLSSDRQFGVQLNTEYVDKTVYGLPVFTGSHGDLLMLTLLCVLREQSPALSPLFYYMASIIVNVSPYIEEVSQTTALKLVSLFEEITHPDLLFGGGDAPHVIGSYLLEAINNLLQYQAKGSTWVIFYILRRWHCFHTLANYDMEQIDKMLGTQSNVLHGVEVESSSQPAHPNHAPPPVPTTDEAEVEEVEVEEVEVLDLENDDEGEQAADSSSSSNNVVANTARDWIESWLFSIPTGVVSALLTALLPEMRRLPTQESGVPEADELVAFIKSTSLVGLLPVPHPIMVRRYQQNSITHCWFQSHLWSVVFMRSYEPPIWFGTEVRLFNLVKTQRNQQVEQVEEAEEVEEVEEGEERNGGSHEEGVQQTQ
eukprot:TRINITY_DN964_c0_g1_i7.p1 TRINITY_DN964_c0_g1~~TRINITY_DN964_c0_g1_i7.p1  ORF type:complete len:717 (-),score=200.79 TRINITY_DN964_c0_g1_i7:979-3129(-)